MSKHSSQGKGSWDWDAILIVAAVVAMATAAMVTKNILIHSDGRTWIWIPENLVVSSLVMVNVFFLSVIVTVSAALIFVLRDKKPISELPWFKREERFLLERKQFFLFTLL